jgi:hypothetical protein
MEKVLIIVNFFKNKLKIEQRDLKRWGFWYNTPETYGEFRKRNLLNYERQISRESRILDSDTATETITVDMEPKGKKIREHLDRIKNTNPGENDFYDYIIYIDGDRDIEFNTIFAILDVLQQNAKAQLCLACRQGRFMMGKKRDSIERFENYLIEDRYNISLPDGQCGCWGIKKEFLDKVQLSAKAFEIELDIIIAALELNIIPYFVPTTLTLKRISKASTFNTDQHMSKLLFLLEKLRINKDLLKYYFENFKKEYRKNKLPDDYLNLFDLIPEKITGHRIVRKSSFCLKNKTCKRCDLPN